MTNYATEGRKSGPMHDDAIAARVVDMVNFRNPAGFDSSALINEKCGRYVRGQHTGKLRGWATWTFVTCGGWKKDGPGYLNGHVVPPGSITSIVISDYSGKVYFSI
jgi:hypothetical protein